MPAVFKYSFLSLFIFILGTTLPMSAYACIGVFAHSETFMISLPDEANERDIIAEVMITETNIDEETYDRISRVRVITPVKGIEKDQILSVQSEIHTCAMDAEVEVGETYFIAGTLNEEGVFEGLWEGEFDD